MATTGNINGTLLGLYKEVSGTFTKIANGLSSDFDMSVDMIETSDKDSKFKKYIPGEIGGTFNAEFRFLDSSAAANVGFNDLLLDAINGTILTVRLMSNVVGDMFLEADVLISNTKLNAPKNDAAGFTCTLQITGEITQGTKA